MSIKRFEEGVRIEDNTTPLDIVRGVDKSLGYLKSRLAWEEAVPDWSTIEIETDTEYIEITNFDEVVPERVVEKRLYVTVLATVVDEEEA